MKTKNGYILGEIAGENVVLPSGNELDLTKLITLNDTGAFIWQQLNRETTVEAVVDALLKEYDVSPENAAASVNQFIQKLGEHGLLEQ